MDERTVRYLVDESHGVDEQFCISLSENAHQILTQFHSYIRDTLGHSHRPTVN